MANRLAIAMTLLFATTVMVVANSTASPAHAQAIGDLIRPVEIDDSLPPLADLSIEVDFHRSGSPRWRLNATNSTIGRHPGITVSAASVRYTVYDQVSAARPSVTGNIRETGVWRIWNLAPNSLVQKSVRVPVPSPTASEGLYPYYIYTEIIDIIPVEPPGYQHNNETEHWAVGYVDGNNRHHGFNDGDFKAGIQISDRSPQIGDMITFTVNAANFRFQGYPGTGTGRYEDTLFGVRTKISLSPGLTLASTPQTPTGTSFDPDTGIWNVGVLDDGYSNSKSLPMAITLTNDDLPLEERCLTVELIDAIPWFTFHPHKRSDDTARVCLDSGTVPLSDGGFPLFYYDDCVGDDAYPCTDADTIELVGRYDRRYNDLLNWVRVDEFPIGSRGVTYFQPEEIVIQIQDAQGRYLSSGKWRSGKTTYHDDGVINQPGPAVHFSFLSRDYNSYTFELSDVSPKQRPGSFSIRGGGAGTFLLMDSDTKASLGPLTLPAPTTNNPYPIFLEFSTLGTYKIDLTVGATKSGTAYTDTGRYTFHVGPMADLRVRDGGANQGVSARQKAYSIAALNDGPDNAPAVQVQITGVPEGAEAIASEGSYVRGTCQDSLCQGVWTIGRLSITDERRASGLPEGPTLVLITDDDSVDSIAATIVNMHDYSICIDSDGDDVDAASESACTGTTGNTWHSTEYYDHIDDNNSATIKARPGTGEGHPDAPDGVRVIETSAANILLWDPVERINGFPVTHYDVQRSASPWTTLQKIATDSMFVDMDLRPGQLMQYRVRAVNYRGIPGPWSAPTLTGPDAPSGFTAEQLQGGDVRLAWTRPDGNGAEITGYTIQVSVNGGQSWSNTGASLGADDTSWVHSNLSVGPTRLYRIRATTANGYGPWSRSTSESIAAPTLIADYNGPSEITLSWTMPVSNAVPVLSYDLDHSTDGNSWSRLATVQAADGMSYVHRGRSPGATVHYRVRASTALGHSPWSGTATATTASGVPRNFRAQANGPNEIMLTWSRPSGDAEIWGYQVERKTEGVDWSLLATVYVEAGTTYVDGDLSAGGTWTYRVRAISIVDGNLLDGDWSAEASATTDSGGPESPKDLSAEADGENAVKLSWTEPEDNGSPITGYRIEHSTDGGTTWELLRARHTGTTYLHSGLPSGTTHHYRVAAINRNGMSMFAAVVSATTGGDATTSPGMPVNLRVTGVDRDRVSIAWDKPDNDGGTRVTGYEYRYRGPCASSPADVCESDVKRVSGTSATVSGLVAGEYHFEVRALNAVGAGVWSDSVRSVVQPEVRGKVVVTPASLTVGEGRSATYRVKLSTNPSQPIQLGLFWDDPDDVLSGDLAGHQGMLLLPSGYSPPEGAIWDDWAYRWDVGIPITVEAVEDDDTDDGTVVIFHDLWTAPAELLGNPEDWAEDPTYHFVNGPAVKVTVRDND